ncbi:hypothetical protein OOU_Y34scaffold00283g93 [Pyricularia oryzae Y34]|uniref:Uncharacterized protein n=3 Tax=Pyricularia oryzae TaxID=318829 RepID=A0A4P7MWJ9_PYROR|nr:hypothetical protein OOU_Y34scaffold00283g93 [Pyricularia oryzae Y34]QBZ54469.1 hypothetical protein PoMZ_10170 [Pyricularia oryzae]
MADEWFTVCISSRATGDGVIQVDSTPVEKSKKSALSVPANSG